MSYENDMAELQVYWDLLDALPGIESIRVLEPSSEMDSRAFDAQLRLRTVAGERELLVQLFRSHLSHRDADHIISAVRAHQLPTLVLAPHIGTGLATKLAGAGVNYLDAHGNCHLVIPPLFCVHVAGKTAAPRPHAGKGMRRPSYQVLFVYLAEPGLLDAPIRLVAERAGVSRQPVADVKHRLLEEEYVVVTKTRTRWHPRRRQDALSLWLQGYESTVRPSLARASYRTRDARPEDLEQRLTEVLSAAGVSAFRWGGSAAGFRITGHHRGERTVVHLRAVPPDLSERLRALPDPHGNLALLDAFGEINWEGPGETVHPLLIYSEMLSEGSERALEAARGLYESHIAPLWERDP
jgi:hypothetical protein